MRVAITGASGFVGSALAHRLDAGGHEVVRMRRPEDWDPDGGMVNPKALAGVDAVVHLAGAGIGVRRWTRRYKEAIRRSRVDGTLLIAETIANLEQRPRVLVSASAIGYYGDRGGEILTEESGPGTGFRAEVCREWEAATRPAADAGIRVVMPRLGIALGPGGGFLGPLLPLARLGARLQFGKGSQYVSWISLADTVSGFVHAIEDGSLRGPVNLCSPHPVTNKELASALGRALHRPSIGFAPRFALRLLAGRERADEVLLSSQRAMPDKLLAAGFTFEDEDIEKVLHRLT